MRVIGLTGGIGSGKSTAAELFAQHGVPIIDTDQIAHALTRPPSPLLSDIAERFGHDILAEDGSLRREQLREHVFSNLVAKQSLEAILHPAIHRAVQKALDELPTDTEYAMVVVPLLFETGSYAKLVERVLVIDCDEATQLARVLLRPGMTERTAKAIMAQQWPRQQRRNAADDVLENNGNLQLLAEQIALLNQQYRVWAHDDQTSLTKRVFKT